MAFSTRYTELVTGMDIVEIRDKVQGVGIKGLLKAIADISRRIHGEEVPSLGMEMLLDPRATAVLLRDIGFQDRVTFANKNQLHCYDFGTGYGVLQSGIVILSVRQQCNARIRGFDNEPAYVGTANKVLDACNGTIHGQQIEMRSEVADVTNVNVLETLECPDVVVSETINNIDYASIQSDGSLVDERTIIDHIGSDGDPYLDMLLALEKVFPHFSADIRQKTRFLFPDIYSRYFHSEGPISALKLVNGKTLLLEDIGDEMADFEDLGVSQRFPGLVKGKISPEERIALYRAVVHQHNGDNSYFLQLPEHVINIYFETIFGTLNDAFEDEDAQ